VRGDQEEAMRATRTAFTITRDIEASPQRVFEAWT
jgi:uncharacterized protein YndB with AHSA1/START domain